MTYSKAEDSVGKKYNMLQCISVLPRKGSRRLAVFLCDCGNTKELYLDKVKSGQQSCGCLQGKNSKKHGASRTKTYNNWNKMRERCKPNFYLSQNYYDRGITVEDPRWEYFPNFLEDMGERPEGLTLDRIDNDRGYCKENCRWATRKEQQSNRRNSRNP
jgi:hypothetical protein